MKTVIGYLLTLTFVLTFAVSAQANLLANGDFEAGWDHWYSGGQEGGFVSLEEESGRRIMYVETTKNDGGKADLRSEMFEVPGDAPLEYRFDSGIWQVTTDSLHPVFQPRFYCSDEELIGQEFIAITTPDEDEGGDWFGLTTENNGRVVPPDGTMYMDVVFQAGDHNQWQGGFKIDNVRIVYLDPHSPAIVTQPRTRLADKGDDVHFTVEAESEAEISYKWYKSDDANIDTDTDERLGTDATLTLVDVGLADEAYYYCEVSAGETVVYTNMVVLGVRGERSN